MVSGSAQAFSISDVIVLHDDPVHWIRKSFWIKLIQHLAYHLVVMFRIQIAVWHHRKTIAFQKLLLIHLAVWCQRIADQIKCPKFQHTFFSLAGVQLTCTAGSQISGMPVIPSQTEIYLLKILPRNDAFTTHFKRFFCVYAKRNI